MDPMKPVVPTDQPAGGVPTTPTEPGVPATPAGEQQPTTPPAVTPDPNAVPPVVDPTQPATGNTQ